MTFYLNVHSKFRIKDGLPTKDVLQKEIDQAFEIVKQLKADQGLCHADYDPSNVMLSPGLYSEPISESKFKHRSVHGNEYPVLSSVSWSAYLNHDSFSANTAITNY